MRSQQEFMLFRLLHRCLHQRYWRSIGRCRQTTFGQTTSRPYIEGCEVSLYYCCTRGLFVTCLAWTQKTVRISLILIDPRKKLDVNRPIFNSFSDKYDEGAQGFAPAQEVYDKYHGRLAQIKSQMVGRGILLDIHGQVKLEF